MGKVVAFPGSTLNDLPPAIVLEGAQNLSLRSVVIVGYQEDGSFYFASDSSDLGLAILTLERGVLEAVTLAQAQEPYT